MNKEISNLINSIADRIRPCKHDWEIISKLNGKSAYNENYIWEEFTYRCKKCGEVNFISTEKLREVK